MSPDSDVSKLRDPAANHVQSPLRRLLGFFVPAVFLFLSCFASIILAKTDVLKEIVLKKFVISNTSEFYDMWIRSPVEPLLKIYVFNYTNLDAVRTGRDKKFKVDEVGPYTYSEFTEKVNVEFNNDSTVTYKENRTYVFLPELSSGKEDDVIVSPKITTISAASMLPSMNVFMHLAMSLVLHSSPTFLKQTVRDFLWVGDNELLTIGAKIMEGKPFGDFGILSMRTGMSRHSITVHTGVKDPTRLNVVSRVDERTSLEAWGNTECDRIDGSAGAIFPADSVSPELPLYVFHPDICRRFPLTYQRHVQTRSGVPALRFQAPSNVFDTPDRNPQNKCFCRDESTSCTPKGVFDMSPCALGAPVRLSFPHFYLGDPALHDVVEGLQPDARLHHTFVDIHEKLGFPLAGIFRLQLNVAVKKGPDSMLLEEFEDGAIVPIVWVEMGMPELPDDLENMVYHLTFGMRRIQLLLIVVALVVAAASTTCLVQRALSLPTKRHFDVDDASRRKLLGSFSLKKPA